MKQFFSSKKFSRVQILSLMKNELRSFIAITFGSLLISATIASLVEPYQFANTGVTGIGLICSYIWNISPVWIISFTNILLLLWGWRALSPRFAFWTLYNTFLTTLALPFFESFQYPVLQNTLVAAVVGGVFSGLGMGLLFYEGGSSGGMDVVAAVVKKRWGSEVGTASFFVNLTILLISLCAVDIERVVMGGITLYIESMTIDFLPRFFDRRSKVLIISRKKNEILDFIVRELERTATLVQGIGGYTGSELTIMMVLLTRHQFMTLKNFIRSVDPSAFLIVTEASEVVGEGFKSWDHDF